MVTRRNLMDTGVVGGNMVRVSISETYDLSTQTNKMSLIGIHTPGKALIQKTYPGLCMNSKYCRILSQDVVIACASMEPADPLQIGTSPGAIAPEDMFNPILYKAVSNASMSQIEYRLHGLMLGDVPNTIDGHQAVVDNDDVTVIDDEFPVYYSLLSNRDGFRTANPQNGLRMSGLVPLVFERLDNAGIWGSARATDLVSGNSFPVISVNEEGTSMIDTRGQIIQTMRGNAKPMPRFPTTILTGASPSTPAGTVGVDYQANGMGNGSPENEQIQMPEIPICFTACIIVPPSKLHKLYYRMVVRTHLEFSEVRPITEIAGFYGLNQYASDVYYSDYEDLSKRFADTRTTQVDVKSADITKIMEGS